MAFRYGETVTLIARGDPTSVDGNGRDVYGNQSETPYPNTVFAPAGSAGLGASIEQNNDTQTVDTRASFTWKDQLPDLSSVDAIRRTNGDVYELEGNPDEYPPMMTGTTILQAHANRVTG